MWSNPIKPWIIRYYDRCDYPDHIRSPHNTQRTDSLQNPFLFTNYTAYVAFPLIDQLYTESTHFTSCFALCILLSVTLRFNKLLDLRWTLEQLEILLDNSKTEKSCQPSFYGNNGKVSLEFLLLFICPNYLMRQIMYSEV